MAHTNKRKTNKSAPPKLIQELKFPAPDVWADLVHDLGLNVLQERELRLAVQHVVLDIENYNLRKSKKPTRDTLVTRLKLMEKALSDLQYEIDRSIHLMNDFLPHETLGRIGKSFTFSEIGQALGEDVFPHDLDRWIADIIAAGKPITIAAIEEKSLPRRDVLGIKHGHAILKHFIESINAPLKKWVEEDKLNKGGRPADVARIYLIRTLAQEAPNIIGRRATISTTGKFADLCSLVLPACGVSAKGIEKAIPPIVRKLRTGQGNPTGKRNDTNLG
jgi:hypothetical protein